MHLPVPLCLSPQPAASQASLNDKKKSFASTPAPGATSSSLALKVLISGTKVLLQVSFHTIAQLLNALKLEAAFSVLKPPRNCSAELL